MSLNFVSVPELGLRLSRDSDLKAGRPYSNPKWTVASSANERAAKDGLLIEADRWLSEFTVMTQWVLNFTPKGFGTATKMYRIFSHVTKHVVLDNDHDAVTSNAMLWGDDEGWPDRAPASGLDGFEDVLKPCLYVTPSGLISTGPQTFEMPSVERERVLSLAGSHLRGNRRPSLSHAFRAPLAA